MSIDSRHHQPGFADRRGVASRLVPLLLVFLVLAQTLGLVHRSLHGDAGNPWRAAAGEHAHAASEAAQPSAWLDELFGDHANTSECLLFDGIAQAGCAPASLVILPLLLPNALLATTHAGFLVRWSALFDARGPPHAH